MAYRVGNLLEVKVSRKGDTFKKITGKDLFVTNLNRFEGEDLIVRVDPNDPEFRAGRSEFQRCCAVAEKGTEPFEEIPREKYVLIGHWDYNWETSNRFPSLRDINRHYEPGRMGWVTFFEEDTVAGYSLQSNGMINRRLSLLDSLYYLPDCETHARVILGDSERWVQELSRHLKQEGIVPIVMTPMGPWRQERYKN